MFGSFCLGSSHFTNLFKRIFYYSRVAFPIYKILIFTGTLITLFISVTDASYSQSNNFWNVPYVFIWEERCGYNSLLNVLDCWLVCFNWYLNWLTNLSKSFRNVSQLISEGVGTKDGPFFSNHFCGVFKEIADKLIAFWSCKLFFMSVILSLWSCLYHFLFSVFLLLNFSLWESSVFFFIFSELFSYLILSLINFRLYFRPIDPSNVFNLFLMVTKDLL